MVTGSLLDTTINDSILMCLMRFKFYLSDYTIFTLYWIHL